MNKRILTLICLAAAPVTAVLAQTPTSTGTLTVTGDVIVSGKARTGSANSTNSGGWATAFGAGNTASGYYSSAFGRDNIASGSYSFTLGLNNTASGGYASVAIGGYNTASGNYAISLNNNTTAQASSSVVMGRWNEVTGNLTTWVATDPLFVIGIGTSTTPKNALTVLKNGNVGINTPTPSAKLEIREATASSFKIFNTGSTSGAGIQLFADLGAPVSANEKLGFILFSGATNATGTAASAANISAVASETWTPTSVPSHMTFETVASNSTVRTERMRIDKDGRVGIGNTAPTAKLHVSGGGGSFGGVVRVLAGGDIPMGNFQTGIAPQ